MCGRVQRSGPDGGPPMPIRGIPVLFRSGAPGYRSHEPLRYRSVVRRALPARPQSR